MKQSQVNQSLSTYKTIFLLAGAFTFAFLLAEMVHEFGHYLAHLAYGTSGVEVHLDPFGGSHIEGVKSLTRESMGITCLAGPAFNLTLGISMFLFQAFALN